MWKQLSKYSVGFQIRRCSISADIVENLCPLKLFYWICTPCSVSGWSLVFIHALRMLQQTAAWISSPQHIVSWSTHGNHKQVAVSMFIQFPSPLSWDCQQAQIINWYLQDKISSRQDIFIRTILISCTKFYLSDTAITYEWIFGCYGNVQMQQTRQDGLVAKEFYRIQ